jgi:ADP-heptose:LPS heptosyltransferase
LHDLKGAVATLGRQKLFDGGPYITVTFTGNERSKVAMQAVLSGAATRVGFTVVPQLYRAPLSYDRSLSQIGNNLRIIEALGHASQHFEPEMFFGDQDLDDARSTLTRGGVQQGQPVVVFVTQTSVTQRKGWRVERFREVACFLTGRYGAHILFVGTAA